MPLEYSLVAHHGDGLEVTLEGRPADPEDAVVLQKVSGLDGPDITEEVDPLPDGDGDYLGMARERGAVIVVEAVMTAPTRLGLRNRERALRAAFAGGPDLWRLRLVGREGDPEDLERDVRVSANGPFRAPDDGGSPAGVGKPFQVALRSPSSTWRGITDQSATVEPAADVGGFSYPYSYPYSYGGTGGTGDAVVNGGDAPSWPLLRLYGPITLPIVENLTLGRGLYFATTLAAGDFLEIDTEARTVLMNGVVGASRYGLLNAAASSWWPLEPGTNAIRLRAQAFDTGARVELTYRNRYR